MKIIAWNCQGAFRNKNEQILLKKPDIIVVPECENGEKLQFGILTPKPNDFLWCGDNPNKGIGIFSYADYKFELMQEYNADFKYILPIRVTGGNGSFVLFAVWTVQNEDNKDAKYIGQIWLAIEYYSKLFKHDDVILIGDFNSNKNLDKSNKIGTHKDVANKLKEMKISSLYHNQAGVLHGSEESPTFFLQRNKLKPFHLDYCFVSEKFLVHDYNFSIGDVEKWIGMSDHLPIIVEITI
jgi:exonuclease III